MTRMKINIAPAVSSRIVSAWRALSADQRSRIAPILAKANQRALTAVQSQKATIFDPSVPHQALLAHSAISNDRDGVPSNLEAGVVIDVDAAGEIWGTGKYQQLDPGWAETIAVWLENLTRNILQQHSRHDRNPGFAADRDRGRLGNWRLENRQQSGAEHGCRAPYGVLEPHLTIHLGDVYFAGTRDQEQHLLVNLWPKGSLGALTLNSNHEMYSGRDTIFSNRLGEC